ncbi:ribonuclease HII [uncultured Nitratireductor sp.]|mgnify:CR=1 FL=1|uniref:ribonuclease HII n=1 Tax=uncultured Nitratireductor sp. TaxID=520953 RepID=UPI0025F72EE4|nr:ribonuclease HII [uncultured Nitratireductor sp.]
MARTRSDSPTLFDLPVRPDFQMEARLLREGLAPVAGLDEAGRGPLAGPVVAAAVILDGNRLPDGLDDSKRLSAQARERLFDAVLDMAVSVSVASLCATSIDGSDILRASLEAMRRAAAGLCVTPLFALADGRDVPPGLCCPARAVVKGDQRSQSIAAASIVAKVTRDRMMGRASRTAPHHGFETHMGYGTKRHRTAITEHGAVLRLHRMSFAPLRNLAEPVTASKGRNADQPLMETGDEKTVGRQPA